MKKIFAIPVTNGVLDAHFGHCSHFAFVEVEDDKIISEKLENAPPHQPGLLPPWIAEKGATDVIAGGMGQRAIDIFNQHKVNVFVGASALTTKEIVEGFIDGTLSFRANYCDH